MGSDWPAKAPPTNLSARAAKGGEPLAARALLVQPWSVQRTKPLRTRASAISLGIMSNGFGPPASTDFGQVSFRPQTSHVLASTHEPDPPGIPVHTINSVTSKELHVREAVWPTQFLIEVSAHPPPEAADQIGSMLRSDLTPALIGHQTSRRRSRLSGPGVVRGVSGAVR